MGTCYNRVHIGVVMLGNIGIVENKMGNYLTRLYRFRVQWYLAGGGGELGGFDSRERSIEANSWEVWIAGFGV